MLNKKALSATAGAAEPAYIEDVFSTYLYTGNGSTQTITNGIDLSGEGGLVWIKGRSTATNNHVQDTARGANNRLRTNTTDANSFSSIFNWVFNSDGFSFNNNQSELNTSGETYASWTFRKAEKFFDVVTYSGTGSDQVINHGLNSTPGCIIIKRTNGTGIWLVWHDGIHAYTGETNHLTLNDTAANTGFGANWIDAIGSSSFTIKSNYSATNESGGTYVAYLFAHDAGGFGDDGDQSVIKCGSFTTNGSGYFDVNLGYEPQWILFKKSSGTGDWFLADNMRGMGVQALAPPMLSANTSAAETTANGSFFYINSTGFGKSNNADLGANSTYIYIAIRRGPMKTPTDATKVFNPVIYTGTNVDNRLVDTTIAPDMVWIRQRNDTVLGGMVVGDRLRGQPYLLTGTTAAEVDDANSFDKQIVSTTEYGTAFSSMSGVWVGNDATSKLNANTTSNNHVVEAFKRAPGFFDVVCYTGTGSATTISHNLGVVPELMIVKPRSAVDDWYVYNSSVGNTKYLRLNTTSASATSSAVWNNTTPTSSVFSIGTVLSVSSVTHVAYLFASINGVSKVGSYTGNGSSQTINCGFTAGARFVLIKRTDSTGDWYVWDTARGIVAGNDPYLLLNSTAAEVTNTDYVDTYSSGFELSSTAPAALNEAFGITWVSRTSQFSTSNINDVTYGNNLYVAVGGDAKISTSPDGITWTARTSGFSSVINGVAYGNSLFVAVGNSGELQTSSDGITWTTRTSGFGTTNIRAVTYGNGVFVAVGDSGTITTSTDGTTWTSRTSNFGASNILSVTYGNGLFVAVGGSGGMVTSPDGTTWTSRTSGFGTTTINDVTYGNGLFVAVGSTATMTTSTDGITWTSRTSGFGSDSIAGVTYGNGTYVAVGANGTLTTSTNGTSWTARASGTTNAINDVAYGNNMFVYVGASGTLRTSSPTYIYLAIA